MTKNPLASFTMDATHQSNPFLNTGITITTTVELTENEEILELYTDRLRRKYSSYFIPELADRNRAESEVCALAKIGKIVYWKGPHFQRFTCRNRMPIIQNMIRRVP